MALTTTTQLLTLTQRVQGRMGVVGVHAMVCGHAAVAIAAAHPPGRASP